MIELDNYDYSNRESKGLHQNNVYAPTINQELGYYSGSKNRDVQITINPDNNYYKSEANYINTNNVNNNSFEKPLIVDPKSSNPPKIIISVSWCLVGYSLLDIIKEIACGYINIFCMIDNTAILVISSLVLLFCYFCYYKKSIFFIILLLTTITLAYGFFAKPFGFFNYYSGKSNFIVIIFFILYFIRIFLLIFFIWLIVEEN